jgi:hypothetical protein
MEVGKFGGCMRLKKKKKANGGELWGDGTLDKNR